MEEKIYCKYCERQLAETTSKYRTENPNGYSTWVEQLSKQCGCLDDDVCQEDPNGKDYIYGSPSRGRTYNPKMKRGGETKKEGNAQRNTKNP